MTSIGRDITQNLSISSFTGDVSSYLLGSEPPSHRSMELMPVSMLYMYMSLPDSLVHDFDTYRVTSNNSRVILYF